MATLLDRFVVEFGLNPANFTKGQKEVVRGLKGVDEASDKSTKAMDRGNRRAAQSLASVRNEVAGLVLAFAGARSVSSFVQNIVTGDAALGRFSASIGVNAQGLAAWEAQARSMGDSADSVRGFFAAMAEVRDDIARGGTGGGATIPLRNLGVSVEELAQGPEAVLLALAERRTALSRDDNQYASQLRSLGLGPGMIAQLRQGREATADYIAEQRRKVNVTDEDIRKSQELQKWLVDLGTEIQGLARGPLYDFIGSLKETGDGLGIVNDAGPIAIGILAGMGVAAAGSLGPLGILAGAVAALTAKYVELNEAGAAWQILALRADKFYAEGMAEANSKSNPRRAGQYLQRAADDADSILRLTEGVEAGRARRAAGNGGPLPSIANQTRTDGAGGTNPEIYRALVAGGLSPAQARGVSAGIFAESRNDPRAFNRAGGGQGAYGIGQWRGPRLAALRKRYGNNPTLAQQVEFLLSELKGGDAGGASVLAAGTDQDALSAYIGGPGWGFMRPDAAGRAGDMRRGMAALGIRGVQSAGTRMAGAGGGAGSTTVTIQNLNIPNARDANEVARELPAALSRRGLTVQSNRGLI